MTWNTLKSDELDFAEQIIGWLHTFVDIDSIPALDSYGSDKMKLARQVSLWITTAQKTKYGDDWLPTRIDAYKSALLERIYNGREPLLYPPPIGVACPWYALVEDSGPHRVGQYNGKWSTVHFWNDPTTTMSFLEDGEIYILQNLYKIVSQCDDNNYVIQDGRNDTPYRFRLKVVEDHWVIQNIEFEEDK